MSSILPLEPIMRRLIVIILIVIVCMLAAVAYFRTPRPTSPTLRRLPAEFKLEQRSTGRVPGSQGSLYLTIDDITRGQVMASLADRDGKPVLAARSLAAGDSATFQFGDASYRLTLSEMDNSLTGDDFATFVVTAATGEVPATGKSITDDTDGTDSSAAIGSADDTPAGDDEIERLIARIESADGLIFIRNGQEYSAQDAAAHLRRKRAAAGAKVTDVETFIEEVASRSSLSGEPYVVRRPDGTEVPAAEYLREQLKSTEPSP